ncbi:hypothetical protein EJ05DRAFT_479056 [Pseudovirgaria hyperparasitica]|uniref:Uncharacterized protein n=1 Tax=Pseudovirgaria hyperparasitica TaxID=470096 RepID=A0A6A6VXD0_9PEZI|nr:uncharacterized protein EJ05DRAFT_479056 [Pseudovirgaria hyperparasitica]KAF2755262.1 hypothetical protein EJ05DRAFT_479056 [Pseudovirgaria hyperparasitica]
MGLKRKCSSLEISPTSSVSSRATDSTRTSQSPSPLPRFSNPFAMDIDQPIRSLPFAQWGASQHTSRISASDLGSRTRKRHRDNRPKQEIVHETTISKLFDAQKHLPDAAPVVSQPQLQPRLSNAAQKSTLHSFWALPKEAPRLASMHTVSFGQQQHCEDCDQALVVEEMMEMDIDMASGGTFACRSCGRHVCDTCSVLGDERCCLECVTSTMQR